MVTLIINKLICNVFPEYFQPRNPYFGCTIGRYANYVYDATMVVRPSGRIYMLSTNKGHHHYNGGYIGFDKVRRCANFIILLWV